MFKLSLGKRLYFQCGYQLVGFQMASTKTRMLRTKSLSRNGEGMGEGLALFSILFILLPPAPSKLVLGT